MKVSKGLPSNIKLKQFWDKIQTSKHSYPQIGATAGNMPKGYDHDQNQILLGKGDHIYKNAKSAIVQWKMFPSNWTYIYPKNQEIEKGESVVVLFKLFGFWWFNACRIVYIINEENHFGFAYGTLKEHIESGEELFEVYKDEQEFIWYRIRAFSRPKRWFAKLGYPVARFHQRRFVKHSLNHMKKESLPNE